MSDTTTFTGLGDLKRRREEAESQFSKRPKATWFSTILSNEGGKVKIRFMQELSPDAELYDADKGTYFGAVEHQAPGKNGFKSRALDTMETEGRDWAQEQQDQEPGLGWHPRQNFYINVAVETAKGVEPAILNRPLGSEFVDELIDIYEDSDGAGITDKTYWLERRGAGSQTRWKLREVKDADEQISLDGVEPWNLPECAVMRVSYERQRDFYMRNADIEGARRAKAKRQGGSVTSDDDDGDEAQTASSPENKYKW